MFLEGRGVAAKGEALQGRVFMWLVLLSACRNKGRQVGRWAPWGR